MRCVVFCEQNLNRYARPAMEQLAAELAGTEAELIEFPCLDRCSLCRERPHAWVNQSTYVDAGSCPELVERIRALLAAAD